MKRSNRRADGAIPRGPINEDALQQAPHPARVHIVNLRTGTEIARLRKTADEDFQFVDDRAVRDPRPTAAAPASDTTDAGIKAQDSVAGAAP